MKKYMFAFFFVLFVGTGFAFAGGSTEKWASDTTVVFDGESELIFSFPMPIPETYRINPEVLEALHKGEVEIYVDEELYGNLPMSIPMSNTKRAIVKDGNHELKARVAVDGEPEIVRTLSVSLNKTRASVSFNFWELSLVNTAAIQTLPKQLDEIELNRPIDLAYFKRLDTSIPAIQGLIPRTVPNPGYWTIIDSRTINFLYTRWNTINAVTDSNNRLIFVYYEINDISEMSAVLMLSTINNKGYGLINRPSSAEGLNLENNPKLLFLRSTKGDAYVYSGRLDNAGKGTVRIYHSSAEILSSNFRNIP